MYMNKMSFWKCLFWNKSSANFVHYKNVEFFFRQVHLEIYLKISTSIKKYGGIMTKILGQCFLSNSWDNFQQINLSNPQNTTVNNLLDFSETQGKIIHGPEKIGPCISDEKNWLIITVNINILCIFKIEICWFLINFCKIELYCITSNINICFYDNSHIRLMTLF